LTRLGKVLPEKPETTLQQSARPAQQGEIEVPPGLVKVVEEFGGGGWTRTNDLRIMSRPTDSDSKELQRLPSADSGKVLQNPHPTRTKKDGEV